MSLYKYVHQDRKDILSNKRIRFTQPATFNDPFESKYNVICLSDPKKLLDILKPILREEIPDILEEELETFISDNPVHLQRIIDEKFNDSSSCQEYKQRLTEDVNNLCILSMSEIYDDLLMWAHYANKHEGFVLEFDTNHSFFRQNDVPEEILRQPSKVCYRRKRPTLTIADIVAQDILFTKSPHWEYEKEWRYIKKRENADKTKNDEDSLPIYLFDIPAKCLLSIILGVRSSDELEKDIKELISKDKTFGHINLYKMVLDNDRFLIHRKPLKKGKIKSEK
ncbi:MAG: DUF2971 domain-containing protein [Sedimentisphaerales bacterium]|nr:DUF2971 domain-containing protein [Sedimentisphaerales bacterium]